MKCTVQEAKFPIKNLVRQHCAEGFNSGVKVLTSYQTTRRLIPHDSSVLGHCYRTRQDGFTVCLPHFPSHSVHWLRKTMIDLKIVSHWSKSNCRCPRYEAVMLTTALCVCWYDYSSEQRAIPMVPGQVLKHVLFKCNRHITISITYPNWLLWASLNCIEVIHLLHLKFFIVFRI
jgi:hypothetical protein